MFQDNWWCFDSSLPLMYQMLLHIQSLALLVFLGAIIGLVGYLGVRYWWKGQALDTSATWKLGVTVVVSLVSVAIPSDLAMYLVLGYAIPIGVLLVGLWVLRKQQFLVHPRRWIALSWLSMSVFLILWALKLPGVATILAPLIGLSAPPPYTAYGVPPPGECWKFFGWF